MSSDQQKILVSPEVLEQMRALGKESGMDIFGEIVRIFFTEFPQQIEEMKALLLHGETENLGKKAHYFKSSCNGVGALSMAQLCSQIETECRNGSTANAKSYIEELEKEFVQVRDILERERNSK